MRMKLVGAIVIVALVAFAPQASPQSTTQVSDDGTPVVGPDPNGGPGDGSFPSDGSLTTLFASDNQFAGNCYDIVANVPLTIVGFDINITDPGSTSTIDIYYRVGTSFGFESDPSTWVLMGSDPNVTSSGQDNPTPVSIGGLTMEPGQVYGIYVDVQSYPSATMRYTNGGPNVYSNADLELTTNCGKGDPAFLGSTFFPRQWNGTIYYNYGGVPTTSSLGLALLVLLLLTAGWLALRRRSEMGAAS